MERDFRIYFNYRKQWADAFLWEVHPTTFANWGNGRWAYFETKWEHPKQGFFGELHFVKNRLRIDTIVHELDHLRTEWMWINGETITRKNEERMADFLDTLVRNFIRELRKINPRILI